MDFLVDGKWKVEEELDFFLDVKCVKYDEDFVELVEEKKFVMKFILFFEKVCDLKVFV